MESERERQEVGAGGTPLPLLGEGMLAWGEMKAWGHTEEGPQQGGGLVTAAFRAGAPSRVPVGAPQGASVQAGGAGGPSGSRMGVGEGARCSRAEASGAGAHACRGGAWGLGDPWATQNEVLGVASPWVGGQGAACQAGAAGGAARRSPGVLGDAGPSLAARGALAWEGFLDGASRPEGRGAGEVGAPRWVQPRTGARGHRRRVAWEEVAWQEASREASLRGEAPEAGMIQGAGDLEG